MQRPTSRTPDIAVISDEMIRYAVCAHGDARNVAAIHPDDASVDFPKVQALSLSFLHIFKLDNLETLQHLVFLQLDNNSIHDIEGLAHLVQLEWLDLSFNQLTTIRGVETLVRLRDLSLFHNAIAKLENLESLQQLQVLSLGHNRLASTEGLLYLQSLASLRVLNLSGNPVCRDAEYRPFVLAHLDRLQFLDYALVDASDVSQAKEQYQDELEELREVQAIEQAARAREQEQQQYMRMLDDANLALLETLVRDMFHEDTEMAKIEALPGLRNLVDEYLDKAKGATEDVKLVLLDKHARLTQTLDAFYRKQSSVQQHAQATSIAAIDAFRKQSKALQKQARPETATSAIALLQEATTMSENLYSDLMSLESDLVETVQEQIAEMEASVDVIGSEARDVTTEHCRVIEVLENAFFESVSQLAVTLLERMATEDAEDEDWLTDECRAVLNDRDALNNAINGSHDIHIGKLLAQEDAMRERSIAKIADKVRAVKETEWARNRARIAEILAMRDEQRLVLMRDKDEMTRSDEDGY